MAVQAIMIFQGKEPTWAEAKSQLGERQQQDDGMNKGRKLKERCRETEPFGPGREGDWELWQRNSVYSYTTYREKPGWTTVFSLSCYLKDHLYLIFIFFYLHFHRLVELFNWGHYLCRSRSKFVIWMIRIAFIELFTYAIVVVNVSWALEYWCNCISCTQFQFSFRKNWSVSLWKTAKQET